MKNVRHQEVSRDSLYIDLKDNLETIYSLWLSKENSLRYSIPILCAIKLEAFINIAGKLKMPHWDSLERKLSFAEKCKIVFRECDLEFDPDSEPTKTAISLFVIRNELVHPKMRLEKIDEHIPHEEYERRKDFFPGVIHHLRSELSPDRVKHLKTQTDEFVSLWGPKLLEGEPGGVNSFV